MSVSGTFSELANSKPAPERRKRAAPFSLRLSAEERARLASEAAGAPLGGYIRAKLLGTPPVRSRRSGIAVEDRQALAQALALLGQARLASNLNQLAHAANIGALAVTPETEAELALCLDEVRELRRLLLASLGLTAEARS